MPHLTTDVLVIGSGGAGMYAAIEAAGNRAQVLLTEAARSEEAAPQSWPK